MSEHTLLDLIQAPGKGAASPENTPFMSIELQKLPKNLQRSYFTARLHM